MAHVFDEFKDVQLMVFAPASNPELSFDKKAFRIIDRKLHPDYKPGKLTNDICVLYVWPWSVIRDTKEVFHIDQVLSPLKLGVKRKYDMDVDRWKILGYHTENSECMHETEGGWIPRYALHHDVNCGYKTILMKSLAGPGMSGGPWTYLSTDHDEYIVNGIQSHRCDQNSVSISPHFTREMLGALGLKIQYTL